MATSTEKIWFEDLNDFILNLENATKFIPDSHMTLNEQLNASFRFSIYFSIVVAIIKQDARVLLFAVFIGLMTIGIAKHEARNKQVKENLYQKLNINNDRQNKLCTIPTKNNPYMNVLISDYKDFPNKPQACNINSKSVKKTIDSFASQTLYRDIDDVFDKNASNRIFYTTPATSIPNESTSFAHWLYNTGATCKEKSIACK
jgi:hypothetical protein